MQSSVVAASAGCSGIKGPLRPDPEFRCAWCLGTARAIDEREVSEVVQEFCYLGDMLSAGGGCELAAITRCKCAWGKFRQLLPLLTNRHLPLLTRGKVYASCVRSVMLHAAETWAMKVDTLNRLRRNDRAMIRWICNVRAKDEVSSDSLLTKLGIQDLDVVLRTSRMRWFGHVERSTGWIAEVRKLNVVAQKEKIWQAKEIMGWSAWEWQKEARYGFCWPSEPFWVERTPSRKTCQKAQPSVEENRALKWIWWWWWSIIEIKRIYWQTAKERDPVLCLKTYICIKFCVHFVGVWPRRWDTVETPWFDDLKYPSLYPHTCTCTFVQ